MDEPRPNPEVSRRHRQAGERPAPPLDAIHEAAMPVKTTILARRGVEKVRILSESRLQSLLGSAREAAGNAARAGGEEREEPTAGSSPPSTPPADPPGAEPDLRAVALRALHVAAIGGIEKRLERLSGALRTISGALERLQGFCPAGRAREAGGESAVPKDLLREMLL
jgi:hypothetical protein